MAVFDLFSKRQRRLRGEMPDVYKYDELPHKLRVQVVHIIGDALGYPHNHHSGKCYHQLHNIIARETGTFSLGNGLDKAADFINFFLSTNNIEHALDCIELSFRMIKAVHDDDYELQLIQPKASAEDAITELNTRFREHGIGFQLEGDEIVRVDSTLLHQDAVKPALTVLREKRFVAAETEFLRAHEHYRHGRHEEAITDALKSLESVLKVICAGRKWPIKETDTAKALLNVAFSNGLVPTYLQSEFTALRTTLESGVPTVRNKEGGHGAGATPRKLPQHLVSYVLHLTASSLVFLAECDASLP